MQDSAPDMLLNDLTIINTPITTQTDLDDFCLHLMGQSVLTIDTEFQRESTYWPKLCLIQIASDSQAVAIDALANNLDLSPLFEIMRDPKILKVFHAARQDLEIFYNLMGDVPYPIFDTQIAAMVCGYGESVGYSTLVNRICHKNIDKSSRFTDWTRRPLTEQQMKYALADVTYLRLVYTNLSDSLTARNRVEWVAEEMDLLHKPETYETDPMLAWKKVRARTNSAKFLTILREVAAWREEIAKARNLTRSRIIKDDTLLDLCATIPKTREALEKSRGISQMRELRDPTTLEALLQRLTDAAALPKSEWVKVPKKPENPEGIGPLTDLLKVLLKHCCEQHQVAQKVICNSADLEKIALYDQPDVPALKGWRAEIFGNLCQDLKQGKMAITAGENGINLIYNDAADQKPN